MSQFTVCSGCGEFVEEATPVITSSGLVYLCSVCLERRKEEESGEASV